MKDKIRKFLKFEGRFNRVEYLKAQTWVVFLILIYCFFIFFPLFLHFSRKIDPSEIINFVCFLIVLTPYAFLIIYGLVVNETKRIRDLMDRDVPVLSVFPMIQFIPIIGFIFFIAIFFLPSGKLKNSKVLDDLEKITKRLL